MKVYSDIIKELRRDKKLTQAKVAKTFGISRSAYANYETGKRHMRVEMISTLADILETSTDYLLGRTAEETPYPPRKPNP